MISSFVFSAICPMKPLFLTTGSKWPFCIVNVWSRFTPMEQKSNWLPNSWHIPGRTFLNHPLRLFRIMHFDTAHRLSRTEVIWALDTLLALLQGIYESTLSKPFGIHGDFFFFLTKSWKQNYNLKHVLYSVQWRHRTLLRPVENNKHIYVVSSSSFKVLVYYIICQFWVFF